jgi:lipopolysaccharide export system protein LptA
MPAASRLAVLAAALGALASLPLPAATFTFQADRMETVLAKGRERTLLSGNAWVKTEENEIRADYMELTGADFQFIRCRGAVRVVNAEKGLQLESQELYYDRQAKVLRINGSVVMVDRKNELVVKGGFLEHWEGKDQTVIQIAVRILKKDLVCRAEYARYLRPENRLELSGMPVVNRKGDEYRALKIFVDLDKDTIRMEGDIRGRVTSEGQEEGAGAEPAGEAVPGGTQKEGGEAPPAPQGGPAGSGGEAPPAPGAKPDGEAVRGGTPEVGGGAP